MQTPARAQRLQADRPQLTGSDSDVALITPFDLYSHRAPLSMSCVGCHVGEVRVAMPSGCRSRPLPPRLSCSIVQCNDVPNAMIVVGLKGHHRLPCNNGLHGHNTSVTGSCSWVSNRSLSLHRGLARWCRSAPAPLGGCCWFPHAGCRAQESSYRNPLTGVLIQESSHRCSYAGNPTRESSYKSCGRVVRDEVVGRPQARPAGNSPQYSYQVQTDCTTTVRHGSCVGPG